jgi:hypothetical protein
MELKPGSRWKSAVCTTEVVVVRPPKTAVTLECGGVAMVAQNDAVPAGATIAPEHKNGTLIGKRYTDSETMLEVLCAKAGEGSLSANRQPLAIKDAKRLPSSD